MTKRQSDMLNELESLGYVYDRTNSKGLDFYIHEDTGVEVKVPGGVNEAVARNVVRTARQLIGMSTKDNKRNPAAIRERNAAEHSRAATELTRLRVQRDALSGSDEGHVRAVEAAFLAAERKFRYWDRLMREAGAR